MSWVDTLEYHTYFFEVFLTGFDHFKHRLSLLFPHHDLNLDAVTLDDEGTSTSRSQDPPVVVLGMEQEPDFNVGDFLAVTPTMRTLARVQ